MPTNPRKMKRFLENEHYAKDARFWVNRVKSADRSIYFCPINRQAAAHLNLDRRQNKQKTMVYVVRFTLASDHNLTFVKIGITSSNPLLRFKIDAKKFILTVVQQSGWMFRSNALALEAALLELFQKHRFRPPVLLASGNSECFEFTPELQDKMKEIIRNTPV